MGGLMDLNGHLGTGEHHGLPARVLEILHEVGPRLGAVLKLGG